MSRMRNMLRGAFALLLVASAHAPAGAQTLSEALAGAYTNNYRLKSARASQRATEEGVAQAVARRLPQISASASASETQTRVRAQETSLGLSGQMNIFDGGVRGQQVKAAKASAMASDQGLRIVEQQVLLETVTAYMNMIRDRQALRLAENNVVVIREHLNVARINRGVGTVNESEIRQAEARLAQAESNLALRQGNLEISREAYRLATGSYPERLISPPARPAIPESLEAAQSIAREHEPGINRAKEAVKAAEANRTASTRAFFPSVTLQASGSEATNEITGVKGTRESISLTAQVPIYQGGQLASARRQSSANLDAALSDLQYATMSSLQNVANNWSQLRVTSSSISSRRKQVEAAELAFKGIEEEYNSGVRRSTQLLDARQELLQARLDLLVAERDQQVLTYSLLAAVGLLNPEHLGLDVDLNGEDGKPESSGGPESRGDKLDRILERAGRSE